MVRLPTLLVTASAALVSALLPVPARLSASVLLRAQYVIEPPQGGGTLQGAGSIPQPGSGLAGPPGLSFVPSPVPVAPALPSAGVAGSSIQPGAGLPFAGAPVATVPIPQLVRPR